MTVRSAEHPFDHVFSEIAAIVGVQQDPHFLSIVAEPCRVRNWKSSLFAMQYLWWQALGQCFFSGMRFVLVRFSL